jgi:transcriptional regulator with XRE-family HTH domain
MNMSNENLSQFVQRVMRQQGLSIRDVQKRAGGPKKIAASYISRIINGQVTNLSVEKIAVLAEGLGVDGFEVFAACYGKQPSKESSVDLSFLLDVMQQMAHSPESFDIVQLWLKLSPQDKQSAKEWLYFLSEKSSTRKKKKR